MHVCSVQNYLYIAYGAFIDWAILGRDFLILATPLRLSDLQHQLVSHPSNYL